MTTGNLSTDIRRFLESNSTTNFLNAARQFVALLEDKKIQEELFYSKVHTALSHLYASGHQLEIIDLKYSSAESDFDKNSLFDNQNADLISGLGLQAYYLEIFDPSYPGVEDTGSNETSEDRKASQGWLTDDFADIYRDLKIELTKIDTTGTDEAVEDALWNLKWSFIHHWGNHCINALRYFHYLYYPGKKII